MLCYEDKPMGTFFEIADERLEKIGETSVGTVYSDNETTNYYLLPEGASGKSETEAALMLEIGSLEAHQIEAWELIENAK
ncbi:MAG TPA: hypothetical protein VNN73_17590 [Blastocatellia bacterium]|nr:hypothetical protein [Blastocatellia bacterium]